MLCLRARAHYSIAGVRRVALASGVGGNKLVVLWLSGAAIHFVLFRADCRDYCSAPMFIFFRARSAFPQ